MKNKASGIPPSSLKPLRTPQKPHDPQAELPPPRVNNLSAQARGSSFLTSSRNAMLKTRGISGGCALCP